ncbi:hypothetical protein MAR_013612 [Mya arenaria]|uniref:THD domain-containing protein n=1 Tax=Mya arenaria TaxID=6604 RepID=A0ABY7G438_MYAAR|nr:hypothetical protein MAR_013612 [Mya arenaria]
MSPSTNIKVFAFASILITCILCISFVSIISSLAIKISQKSIKYATNMCVSCDELQSFPGFPAVASEDIDRIRSAKNKSSCCSSTDVILRMQIQKKMDEQVYEYNSGLATGNENLNNPFRIVNELKDINKPELSGVSLLCTGVSFSQSLTLSVAFSETITHILGKDNCDLVQLDENVPRAKVVGVVDHVWSSFQTDLRKVRWKKNGASATYGNIIHLEEEGEIFIRQDGTYIVLSNLRIHRDPSTPFATNFSHVLYQFSHRDGSETILMQRSRTLCNKSDDQYDSYISAVFRLHKYDRISIHTTHAQHLQINDTENFFGVFFTYDMY